LDRAAFAAEHFDIGGFQAAVGQVGGDFR
jgi:hypothetical protein